MICKVIGTFFGGNNLVFDVTFILGINVLNFPEIMLLLYFELFVLNVFFLQFLLLGSSFLCLLLHGFFLLISSIGTLLP